MDQPGPILRSVRDSNPDSPAIPPGHVSITEAAQRLRIHRDTLRQRVRRGTLEAAKVDGQWYIKLDQPELRPATPVPDTPAMSGTGVADTSQQQSPDTVPDSVAGPAEALALAQAELRRADELARILQGHYDQLQELFRTETDRLHELLRAEQETRRREVSELHILLQRTQAQLGPPLVVARPESVTEPESVVEPQAHSHRRRRWWWPFSLSS